MSKFEIILELVLVLFIPKIEHVISFDLILCSLYICDSIYELCISALMMVQSCYLISQE